MVKRVLALAAAATVLAAAPASAQADVDACTFSGVLTVTPALPALLTGPLGQRSQGLSLLAQCEVVRDGQHITTGATLDTLGAFTNVVCGTGRATGAGFLDAFDAQIGRVAVTTDVTFVNGVGSITLTGPATGPTGIVGAGAIRLEPVGSNCIDTNVSRFNATGAFVAAVP